MSQRDRGFSMIEVMILVVIVGLLAAIAIPNFIAMQERAKMKRMDVVDFGHHGGYVYLLDRSPKTGVPTVMREVAYSEGYGHRDSSGTYHLVLRTKTGWYRFTSASFQDCGARRSPQYLREKLGFEVRTPLPSM